ncbi:hypothetical protein F2Q69_00005561 [Brassica cretica]|uniref:Uncharacterized protein n=1 Tax=Brassica cretica TaxID=69181 RepID=A0A8S9P9E4_BRACR|nr:hypothetical protein F2Q69_00005561 [Brassica cretica]
MSMRDGETRGSDLDAGETKASSCKGRDGGAGAVAKPELETKARGRRRSQTRLAHNTKRQTEGWTDQTTSSAIRRSLRSNRPANESVAALPPTRPLGRSLRSDRASIPLGRYVVPNPSSVA